MTSLFAGNLQPQDDKHTESLANILNEYLRDAVIETVDTEDKVVTFSVKRMNGSVRIVSKLKVINLETFFYRRFETGMIRKGFANIKRLRTEKNGIEYISEVSKWYYHMKQMQGIQILLYSGSILRFVGNHVEFIIEDENEVEDEYILPDHIETPLTRLLYFPERIIEKSKEVIERIQQSIEKAMINIEEMKVSTIEDEEPPNALTTKILEFGEDPSYDATITPVQQELYNSIISRIDRQLAELDRDEPEGEIEILGFDDLMVVENQKLYHYDIFRSSETSLEYSLAKYSLLNAKINAVVTLNGDLSTNGEGILANIPVLIKDTILTKKMRTTAGSEKYDHIPEEDAEVVKRLRTAGAIILGKTNTSELALDVQTYNPIFGLTNNPWNHELTAGGSSGGSAAAVMLSMAPLALGSDLAGSLRIPAAFCGVVSFRPTPGRIPTKGHLPELVSDIINQKSQELVIGPLAKNTKWLEIGMRALCDKWHDAPDNFRLKGMITPNLWFIKTEKAISLELENLCNYFNNIDDLSVELFEPSLNYKELIRAHNFLTKHILGEEIPSEYLDYSVHQQDKGKVMLDEYFDLYDFWILPVSPVQPYAHNLDHNNLYIDGERVQYWKATISYCSWLSVLGNPVLTIPISFIAGLPLGVQIVGRRGKDEELMAIGRYLEKLIQMKLS